MDKVLAFSILRASPADIASGAGTGVGGRWERLSWRRSADGGDQATGSAGDQPGAQARQKRDKDRDGKEEAARRGAPRFAPEFDGIDCFETIVSH